MINIEKIRVSTAIAIISVVSTISIGFLLIYIWEPDTFKDVEFFKLTLLSVSLTLPLILMNFGLIMTLAIFYSRETLTNLLFQNAVILSAAAISDASLINAITKSKTIPDCMASVISFEFGFSGAIVLFIFIRAIHNYKKTKSVKPPL